MYDVYLWFKTCYFCHCCGAMVALWCSDVALWCSGYHYCITSFIKTWTQVLHRFKSCSQHVGDSQWWRSLTMVPAVNKAKRLSSVNHTIKAIHHHHHSLGNRYCIKTSYFSFFSLNQNNILNTLIFFKTDYISLYICI